MLKKKFTVGIIEDEVSLSKALQEKLESEDFAVLTSGNGKDGLAMALEERPDILLIDILMPKMNGMEVLKELRKNTWGKTVPVIIITNLNEVDEVATAMSEGVYEYIVKKDTPIESIIQKIKEKLLIK